MKKNLLIILFFVIFLPLFFYNLGGYGLADFDEGWYAEVARNILVNKDPLLLTFNGMPFVDHPPFGFILMAFSYLIFGVNEFAARFPSAVLGWGSVLLTYLIGRALFNKYVGIAAGLILMSSVWFLFRARSGNLDTPFLFFYLLTFYLAVKLKNNPKWIYLTSSSLAFLLQVKAVVGISVLIPISIFLLINKVRVEIKDALYSLLLFSALILPWLLQSYFHYGWLYFDRMISFGLKPGFRIKPNLLGITSSNTYLYLHYGITKWFYPSLISLVGGIFLVRKNKNLIPLYCIILVLGYGFLTNSKTEIWHLIPLYPFLAIIASYFFWILCFRKTIIFMIIIYAAFIYQLFNLKNQVRFTDKGLSDLAFVASYASNFDKKLYLDGHDFFPSTVFYAKKNVRLIRQEDEPKNSLKGIVEFGEKPFLLLTEGWKLEADKIDKSKYSIIAKRDDRLLINVH